MLAANNAVIGTITNNGDTGTAVYVHLQTIRLKENITDMTDATTRLKQLKPKRNFKSDERNTLVDGFLAHEVSGIVPEAGIRVKKMQLIVKEIQNIKA